MCIRDSRSPVAKASSVSNRAAGERAKNAAQKARTAAWPTTVSYTHLRAHETVLDIVCRLLLEKKKQHTNNYDNAQTLASPDKIRQKNVLRHQYELYA